MQRSSRFLALLALLTMVCSPRVAPAQGYVPPLSLVVAEHWGDVTADSASLAALTRATYSLGGETVLRGVLSTASDPARPYEVRLHALAILVGYMDPGTEHGTLQELRGAGRAALSTCAPSEVWSPGDTLRSCAEPGRSFVPGTSHPNYRLSSSIEPALRDTIRLSLRRLSEADEDRRIRGAARLLWNRWTGGERWSEHKAEECRARAADSLDLRTAAEDHFWRFKRCEVTGGEILARAWRRVPPDTTILLPLLVASQEIRDRRLQRALQEVALDPERPLLVRVAALEALATLAHPKMRTISLRDWDQEGGACVNWGWHAHHAVQEEGGVPMGGESREEIREFLYSLAESRHHLRIRREAGLLAECLDDLSGRDPTPGW